MYVFFYTLLNTAILQHMRVFVYTLLKTAILPHMHVFLYTLLNTAILQQTCMCFVHSATLFRHLTVWHSVFCAYCDTVYMRRCFCTLCSIINTAILQHMHVFLYTLLNTASVFVHSAHSVQASGNYEVTLRRPAQGTWPYFADSSQT